MSAVPLSVLVAKMQDVLREHGDMPVYLAKDDTFAPATGGAIYEKEPGAIDTMPDVASPMYLLMDLATTKYVARIMSLRHTADAIEKAKRK